MYWTINAGETKYKSLKCRLQVLYRWAGVGSAYQSGGGKIFAGSHVGTGTENASYADSSFGTASLGGNDFAEWTEPQEFNITLKNQPSKFFVGIQNWWRGSGGMGKVVKIYDFILVE